MFSPTQDYRRYQLPAFGSWDCFQDVNDFSRCFESARQAGFIRYAGYPASDRDLYVAGDLYENDVVTPTMIVVPRQTAKVSDSKEKGWENDYDGYKESPFVVAEPKPNPKPVDEDLYKISPDLLYANSRHRKKKRVLRFLCCLVPCSS